MMILHGNLYNSLPIVIAIAAFIMILGSLSGRVVSGRRSEVPEITGSLLPLPVPTGHPPVPAPPASGGRRPVRCAAQHGPRRGPGESPSWLTAQGPPLPAEPHPPSTQNQSRLIDLRTKCQVPHRPQ